MTVFILSRPAEVLRVKGFLDLLFTADAWDTANGKSELVFIGKGLDKGESEEAFAVCLPLTRRNSFPEPPVSER